MTPSGDLTTLVEFTGVNGVYPSTGLVQGRDGAFYGTTSGEVTDGGTVFRMLSSGAMATLVDFNGYNGSYPNSELLQGSNGSFYGVTVYGSNSLEPIFALTPSGGLKSLASFPSPESLLTEELEAALMQGPDGNIYATNKRGGSSDLGAVYQLTPSGQLTTLLNFTGANGSYPSGGLVQGLDGNFYGTASNTIYRLVFASEPTAPSVISSRLNGISTSEVIILGSVNPNLADTTVQILYGRTSNYDHITSAQELGNGKYPVAFLTNLPDLAPGTLCHYAIVATNSQGSTTGSDATFTTLAWPPENTVAKLWAGVLRPGKGSIDAAAVSTRIVGNQYTLTAHPARGYAFANWTISNLEALLSPLTSNPLTFVMTGPLTVKANFNAIAPTGMLVANRGDAVPGGAGATFAAFGAPQTGVFLGMKEEHRNRVPTVFSSDGEILLEKGAEAPGLPGTVIAAIGQQSGDAAFVTLALGHGGITSKNSAALISGLSSGAPRVVAQSGVANIGLPAGVTIKTFLTLDGDGANAFFLASLQGSEISAGSDIGLCSATAGGVLNILVRNTQKAGEQIVSRVTTLVGSEGTAAARRWRIDDAHVGVRLAFSDGSETIYSIPAAAATPADWTQLATTGTSSILGIDGATITSFGLPGFGPQGCAVLAHLQKQSVGTVTKANDVALLAIATGRATVLARKGDKVTSDAAGNALTGVAINGFRDPIEGANGRIAFLFTAREAGAEAISARFSTPAIGYSSTGTGWTVLANANAEAPGGGRWAGFPSMALPGNSMLGPVFTGQLKHNAMDGVTAANDFGLWAATASGEMQLLLSNGNLLPAGAGDKTVRTFTALAPAGAGGTASGYRDDGSAAVLATFTDGSKSLVILHSP